MLAEKFSLVPTGFPTTFSDNYLNVVFNGEPAIFIFEDEAPFSFIKKADLDLKERQFSHGVPECG